MSSETDAFSEIIETLWQTRQANYSLASALTFLAFDICITFDQEVKYIWKERWSLPKVLYLFGRYYGLLDLIVILAVSTREELSLKACRAYFGFFGFGGPIIFVTLLNILFVLRIHAVYNRSNKMLMFLLSLFFLELAGELIIVVKDTMATMGNVFEPPPGFHWPGCVTIPTTFSTLVGWIPSLFVCLTFFILTLVKFAMVFRDHNRGWRLVQLRDLKSFSPILVAFVLDGTVFFFLIFSTVLVSTITNQVLDGPFAGIGLPWATAIYSFSASRLVLNIRDVALKGNESTVGESIPLSTIRIQARRPYTTDTNTDFASSSA